ncbi:hypothetical protein N431DRAFT_505001 [Stipitochalara longipes BDJ]|nr:hypothetical protein N431DRAFT_505001 [Stipitochalara longipes BDJ]
MAQQTGTKYLNGLRGFAALLVYWHHHELWAHQSSYITFERAFGYRQRYHFANLPWIRIFFNGGHYATAIFFLVSGYVLSIRPLDIIARRNSTTQQGELANHLASSLFRRWFRLYLPLICTTFIYMTSWHVFGLRIRGVQPRDIWRVEAKTWLGEIMDFSFCFSRTMEFKGSLVNLFTLLALSRSSRNARLVCELGLITYFMYAVSDGWYLAFFIAGLFLRELDTWYENKIRIPQGVAGIRWLEKCFWISILLFSMYLGGFPHCATAACLRKNPGWYFLSFLTPPISFAYDPKWFYLLPAAVLLLTATRRIPWLRNFFENLICQHLGHISYSLYLVHGPIMRIFADTLLRSRFVDKFPISTAGPLALGLSFLIAQLIILPLTLGIAEVVTWTIDKPSNNFSHWLYRKTIESGQDSVK